MVSSLSVPLISSPALVPVIVLCPCSVGSVERVSEEEPVITDLALLPTSLICQKLAAPTRLERVIILLLLLLLQVVTITLKETIML
jgi:hypothetical protein